MDTPILKSGSILLRPYRVEDSEEHVAAVRESIAALKPWMPWAHEGYSLEESRKWLAGCIKNWADGTAYEFTIVDSKSGMFLGGCGLNHLNTVDKWANLGYWVRSSQTGRGIATMAASLLIPYGFKELKLNRIEIVVAKGNKASQRVALKCGAKKEGEMRSRLFLHGKPCDAMMFSIIPGDT